MIEFKVITIHRHNTDIFFFANNHSDYGLGDDWVPVTSYYSSKEDMEKEIKRLKENYNEIPCPDIELDNMGFSEHYSELRRRKERR